MNVSAMNRRRRSESRQTACGCAMTSFWRNDRYMAKREQRERDKQRGHREIERERESRERDMRERDKEKERQCFDIR